jgi:HSP20 family protein
MTMLNSLKEAGRNIGREIGRTWENLSYGWRELVNRSSAALTHFSRDRNGMQEGGAPAAFPRWSLLAGEVEETDRDILVRVEVPGLDKKDCRITIEDDTLCISGEKHYVRETRDSTFHVMERAYGAFRRNIPLPRNVDADRAEARYRNGVLSIRLPKMGRDNGRTVTIN